jgi:hypothetical protein
VDPVEIALPSAIAQELVADGIGWRALRARSAGWVAIATLTVDSVSTLVILTVNRTDLLSAVRRVTAHAKEKAAESPMIQVHISVDGVSHTISEENDEAGALRLEVRVLASLEKSESKDDESHEI